MTEEHRLQARIKMLEEEIEDLRELLAPQWQAPSAIQATQAHDRILSCLLQNEGVSTDQMLVKAMRRAGDYSRYENSSTLKVQICFLRKKLARFGLSIETAWGKGYYLTDATRHRLLNWPTEQSAAA